MTMIFKLAVYTLRMYIIIIKAIIDFIRARLWLRIHEKIAVGLWSLDIVEALNSAADEKKIL